VLPRNLLGYWNGADPPDGALIPGASITDYERACAVTDDIALIDVGPGAGIVLRNEPFDTMWLRRPDDRDLYLVRWEHGESDEEVYAALDHFVPRDEIECISLFAVPGDQLVLLEAAMPGTDILTAHEVVDVDAARYRVTYIHFTPDPRTAVHVYHMCVVP
jgi:hypothetical protein